MAKVKGGRPHVNNLDPGGQGVQAQRGGRQPFAAGSGSVSSPQGIQAARTGNGDATRAPFPFYGGKRRWADTIWSKLGNPGVYAEPFAGSLAVLLHRTQPCPREIVCDLDGLLCNFWRALASRPRSRGLLGRVADDPPRPHRAAYVAAQLARGAWRASVETDPDFYDVKVAGWWVWGLSNWIGGGWCADGRRPGNGQIPSVLPTSGAYGVQAQRVGDGTPGVQAQRGGQGKRPHVGGNGGNGGQGVQPHLRRGAGDILDGSRWQPWFAALAKRLGARSGTEPIAGSPPSRRPCSNKRRPRPSRPSAYSLIPPT